MRLCPSSHSLVSAFALVILTAVSAQADRSTRNNSSGGSSAPPPSYAVIDLGTNNIPVALSNTGFVLLQSTSSGTTTKWMNGSTIQLNTSSAQVNGIGIADDGTVVGNSLSSVVPVAWRTNSQDPTALSCSNFGLDPAGSSASVIDYNGNIYGSIEGTDPGSDNYNPVGQAAYWNSASTGESLWSGIGFEDDPDSPGGERPSGSIYTISCAKNGHTAGSECVISYVMTDMHAWLTEVTSTPLPTIDRSFALISATCLSSSGNAIGNISSGPSDLTYINGSIGVIPGALGLQGINKAFYKYSNGAVSSTECPQIVGYDSSFTPRLYQMNPTTGNYENTMFSNLVDGSSGWSAITPVNDCINDSGAIVGTATYSGTNYPTGSHGVLLAPFVVSQSNYPVPSTSDSTTDSGASTASKVIAGAGATDGVALITGAPAMPQLAAQIMGFGSSSGLTVDWRIAVTSERSERGTKDNLFIPAAPGEGGAGGPGVVDNQPINVAWNIPNDYLSEPQEFFGGNVTVYYRIKKADGTYIEPSEQVLTTFKIRGLNPLDALAKSYIQSNEGDYFFAWAIAQHESRQTYGSDKIYNEFNAGGSQAKLPNFSGTSESDPQDGWGIFQRDDTAAGIYVDTDQVYSWAVNTSVAMNELAAKQSLAQDYFDAIQRVNPTTYEPPPDNQTIWGQSGDPATSTTLTALQAATITLYNGASVAVRIQDAGTDSDPTYTTYLSCWQFNPSAASGHRWTFVPNANDYVYKVIHNEYETSHSLSFTE